MHGDKARYNKIPYQFIDNLPKDKHDIVKMMKDVNRHIQALEEQFFMDEDSEEEEKRFGLGEEQVPDDHNKRLVEIKQMSNLQQFWCIPLCR